MGAKVRSRVEGVDVHEARMRVERLGLREVIPTSATRRRVALQGVDYVWRCGGGGAGACWGRCFRAGHRSRTVARNVSPTASW